VISQDQPVEDTAASEASPPPAVQKKDMPAPVPFARIRPVLPGGSLWPQIVSLAKYLVQGEVHTYAYSVAANVILAFFPFIVLLLTLAHNIFHSAALQQAVVEMMQYLLPTAQTFILKNAHPNKGAQIFSIVMLLVSSSGVFLPLEVALNNVWGVRKGRNYLHNLLISLGLAFAVGALAMLSVALTAGQKEVLKWVFFGHTNNVVFNFVSGAMIAIVALILSILLFFLIYWILPNRKVPARAVLPTAIVIGIAWEGAKYLYVLALPRLDFPAVYGPFYVTVGLMMWAFLSGLLLLAGAHFSATQFTIAAAREAELDKKQAEQEEQSAQEKKGPEPEKLLENKPDARAL
jgi:membrane protein